MTSADDLALLQERIHAARIAAAGQMAALGGTSSACAMGRDGRSFPAYKYFEGQAAVYGDLLRALRRGEPDEVEAIIGAGVDAARTQLERHAARGRDWESYATGALDAALAASEMSAPRH